MTACLTIDLQAITANYDRLCDLTGSAVAGVVKADAYGLGALQVAAALEKTDCACYFTAFPDEALSLRAVAQKTIYALAAPAPFIDDMIRRDITPVLNSLHDIALWRSAARRLERALPVALHFDTGMNRLGLPPEETGALFGDSSLLEGLRVDLVMSHFACADEKGPPMTARQYEDFKTIAVRFPQAKKSIANSSGLFRDSAYHLDMVRPGMALYGLNPAPEAPNPMLPVVMLDTPLLQVKTVKAAASVGYGATHKIRQETKIGTVALGYADGFLRSLGNHGALYFNGVRCPVIGRVSMDLVTVNLGEADARPGDRMEVIGPHQSADDLAAAAGTIGYEILTSLGGRYKRVYK